MQRINNDKQKANKKIGFYNKLIIAGVLCFILVFIGMGVSSALRGDVYLPSLLAVLGIVCRWGEFPKKQIRGANGGKRF